ncbi:GNAT family N-acetyltransferase [Haloarcula argentinensis]|uniref:GNAT family N-acetyltransferase n=1 Tax=Haloarcula argentinensis TaxID=43776 RepID=A0ABU2F0R7_HALAR|nr:GNAT family N-acetyltransferase [Haloarcula argentinensis]EMA18916.1 acetyltransferase [Haloarcula argentinensis DSM 12282]MDS0254086.1 GNAT family N-acetyltransferase [Haloarcula argentinensis]
MTDQIQFRSYDDRDADAVWRLHEWAIRATGNDPSDIPGTSDLENIETRYFDSGGAFLVGVVPDDTDELPQTFDGGLAAMGGFLPNDVGHADERTVPGAAELHRMRVAPSRQRRGYGRNLLHKLEQQVAERGYEVLLATTSQSQPAAVAFYRDEGYQEVGRSTQGEYELVHFEKRL